MDAPFDSSHFLSLPRPDILLGPPPGVPDTTTLAAHDFDIDTRTGFMPPQPPLPRLPAEWEAWESTLDRAISEKLKLGDTPDLSAAAREKSEAWRDHVRNLSILPITDLIASETTLRRAHHVLAWILHFYIHTLPSSAYVHIPPPLCLPLLQVSKHLQLPPVLTYSDDVLYNWDLLSPDDEPVRPALDNLRCQTMFTGTKDEEVFYLTSARIELRGVDALDAMQDIMDEAFVGDALAVRRITGYLGVLADVIRELRAILLSVREGCDPEVFYHEIRPWFCGIDSVEKGKGPENGRRRVWVWEGVEMDGTLSVPTELSGPSAGQSALVHALDLFLGVDQYSEGSAASSAPSSQPGMDLDVMQRMQVYMPRHHRAFLAHLGASPRPLRAFVENACATTTTTTTTTTTSDDHVDAQVLREAYNAAVLALKEFRDAHMQVVALYIVGPSRRPRGGQRKYGVGVGLDEKLKGTGGTDLVRFLKGVRDRTEGAVLRA